MQIGFIGLGKMGSRMAGKLLTDGHTVVVWNRSKDVTVEFSDKYPTYVGKKSLQTTETIENLVSLVSTPRVLWLMLPAGEATESVLAQIIPLLNKGDIVIDGGNAHFQDTQKRFEMLREKGIRFLGIGVSGGIISEKEGYPIMVGGDKSAYDELLPIFQSLAKPHGGYEYFGEGGAGHFVKMIHNGIEYGIMQSLGEGFEVLEKAPYGFDLIKVAQLWQKGTLVSGFMLDRVVDSLIPDPKLEKISGVIAESGEAKWTIEQAQKEDVDVEIIERSLVYRKRSQTEPRVFNSFCARLVAALRHAFGGHAMTSK